MIVRARKILRWDKTKASKLTGCGLCGRTFRPDEGCMRATWLCESGLFLQSYHPACAEVVKVWGYPARTVEPRQCEKWAIEMACEHCPRGGTCPAYVFDCAAAMERLVFIGALRESGNPVVIKPDPEQEQREEDAIIAADKKPCPVDAQKARRERLKAAGLCVICGKRRAIEGQCRCEVCKRRERENMVRREAELRAMESATP